MSIPALCFVPCPWISSGFRNTARKTVYNAAWIWIQVDTVIRYPQINMAKDFQLTQRNNDRKLKEEGNS